MTLILTALCKNGVCIIADKRIGTWDSNGSKKHEDNLNKIFEFKEIPLIIFNHGLNKFNNKSWRELCSEYENSGQWKSKKFIRIADDFKNFIDSDIKRELKHNQQNNKLSNYTDLSNTTGFVLCGKASKDNKFKAKEFFWFFDSNEEIICKIKRHKGGLIQTGIGIKYLTDYLKSGKGMDINSISYWKKLNIAQSKIELEKLFNIAVEEKKQCNGDEFSDNFDFNYVL